MADRQPQDATMVVIFDFDGTLVDSLGMAIDVSRSLMPQYSSVSDEQIEALRKLSIRHAAKQLGVPLWKLPLLVRKGRAVVHARMHELSIIPDIPMVLKTLHDQGYALYILSSNSQDNIQTFLTEHGIGGYFSGIVGDVGLFGKARAIRRLCKKQRIARSHAWYVGDEVRDIVAARKAGVRSVAVGWGFNHPEALMHVHPDACVLTPHELLTQLVQPTHG